MVTCAPDAFAWFVTHNLPLLSQGLTVKIVCCHSRLHVISTCIDNAGVHTVKICHSRKETVGTVTVVVAPCVNVATLRCVRAGTYLCTIDATKYCQVFRTRLHKSITLAVFLHRNAIVSLWIIAVQKNIFALSIASSWSRAHYHLRLTVAIKVINQYHGIVVASTHILSHIDAPQHGAVHLIGINNLFARHSYASIVVTGWCRIPFYHDVILTITVKVAHSTLAWLILIRVAIREIYAVLVVSEYCARRCLAWLWTLQGYLEIVHHLRTHLV